MDTPAPSPASPDSNPVAESSPRLVLASSSRYRRALLERLGVEFAAASPDIDESRARGESPESLVRRLAHGKAQALAARFPEHLIIGSDQVAALGDDVLGKPGTAANAEAQLARLSGQRVAFLTGLTVLDSARQTSVTELDRTMVQFRELSAAEIRSYVAREQPLDCAGSFKSEGLGVTLFERIDSQDPTGLIGLPLIQVCACLRRFGLDPLLQSRGLPSPGLQSTGPAASA
ncbi:MAG: nucleoside triphosphate pyrophosphatase [Pseudomonadota bacterium]